MDIQNKPIVSYTTIPLSNSSVSIEIHKTIEILVKKGRFFYLQSFQVDFGTLSG